MTGAATFCSLTEPSAPAHDKFPLNVEVQLRRGSTGVVNHGAVQEATRTFLESLVGVAYTDGPLDPSSHPLAEHIQELRLVDCDPMRQRVSSMAFFWNWSLDVRVFELSEEDPEDDDGADNEGEEQVSMFREWALPCVALHGLWDSLHYDDSGEEGQGHCAAHGASAADPTTPAAAARPHSHAPHGLPTGGTVTPGSSVSTGGVGSSGGGGSGGSRFGGEAGGAGRGGGPPANPGGPVKPRLLRYAASALLFSQKRVDSCLVAWNRVVLLHGPPGTGKTSLCKALAQKLAIKFGNSYPAGCALVEVNAHSLFSKYFSESGKLVGRLFSRIHELVEDGDALVFVLIDEVESLTAARKAGGSEPTDAIRAVNALLTSLDQLRHCPNVMILTTSNITGAIDAAFIDRADIKAYIGPPSLPARYKILRSALLELCRAGICTLRAPGQPGSEQTAGPSNLPDQPAAAASPPAAAAVGTPPVSDAQLLLPFTDIPENPTDAVEAPRETGDLAVGAGAAGSDADCGVAAMDCGTGGDGGNACGPAQRQAARGPTAAEVSCALRGAAMSCAGYSGRALRKLPFLAHAASDSLPVPCPALQFIDAIRHAAEQERRDRQGCGAQVA